MDNLDNDQHIKKIQEQFVKLIENYDDPICLLFVKCVINSEKGNLSEIGISFQKISEFLLNRIYDLEFKSEEKGDSGRNIRLEVALESINKIGKELEQMEDEEQCSYHWSIIGILLIIIMSLFNHIEIDTE
jgi:hypothetical protein